MSSIEACRTEALGGHVAACTKCNHQHIAYNSCKNRHCPKCQGPAARDWELLSNLVSKRFSCGGLILV
jgi:hypothetical protein